MLIYMVNIMIRILALAMATGSFHTVLAEAGSLTRSAQVHGRDLGHYCGWREGWALGDSDCNADDYRYLDLQFDFAYRANEARNAAFSDAYAQAFQAAGCVSH
jgi:hypothetical protein